MALPTVDSFRSAEGWIHDTRAVEYKKYFVVAKAGKAELMAQAKGIFTAAGVELPQDLSMLWAKRQAYLNALKSAVDATASEWQINQSKCKGYACRLAKKAIKKKCRGASIKRVQARSWRISKNGLGIPTNRYQSMWVTFKVRGEPYCQVRSLTAREVYKGSGRYQRAKGTGWGFARFQKRCK